ncbi:Vps5-domain-containing protein [Trametes coccinea BRFM310]|uniref:Vps5-domain-containing protein n=1 Tax=Trametes coccinea (strain BRFM310) TaxID=1353009 RepID=A0A1Y2IQK8_TRAC3|nr:Vps5-domain-containing protein [Trametes coccinea BRFM310]
MDSGFDDLLAPSRDALANPFEDPFSKPRSNSPDPWASFGHTSSFNEEAAAFGSTSPTAAHHNAFADVGGFQDSFRDTAPDPLDAPAFNAAESRAEEEESSMLAPAEEVTSPTTPGFRESISTEAEEPESRQEEKQDKGPLREPTPPVEQPAKAPTPPIQPPIQPTASSSETAPTNSITTARLPGHTSRNSTASLSSSHVAPLKAEPVAYNPLVQPTNTLERSIAGLSIGGEALGGWQDSGWQSSQPAYASAGPSASATSGQSVSDDDDDDDRPIAQTMAARAAKGREQASAPPSEAGSSAPTKKDNGIQPVFVISVDDPQKVGDPIRPYTMYTVHTKTTSPMYKKSTFSVLRRYSDFLWLYETLSMNNPGVVVPPVPEKAPFGRFDNEFVQQRRLGLEKCIQKIANHPVLQKDPDLRLFLESDTFSLDIKHRKAEIAQEKGGLITAIGQTIAGPRFHETDEWFDRQKAYLDSLETQLRGLVKSIEAVARHRQEVAAAAGEFAQTIADLAACDVGKQLSASLSGLAEVERLAQELQSTQAHEDMITVLSTADEYARLINSVRLAFNSRVRVYHAWQSADAHLKRTKQTHESNRAQGKLGPEALSRSLALVADAERKALDARQEFDHVSRLVKSEVARFEQERIEDFKASLEAFLDGMISRQKQLIKAWESYQQTLLKRVAPQSQGQQQRQPDSPVPSAA